MRHSIGRTAVGSRLFVTRNRCVALLIWAALLLAPRVQAQVLYGSLVGTVTDPAGAAVPGANITALEVQPGVKQTGTSDSSGIYRFTALLPGTYKVTITGPQFSTQETAGVLVRANEIARVDAQLKVGSATQNITVTTAPPLLQTDSADVHTDITAKEIQNLPIMGSQGGNFQELLRTVPEPG